MTKMPQGRVHPPEGRWDPRATRRPGPALIGFGVLVVAVVVLSSLTYLPGAQPSNGPVRSGARAAVFPTPIQHVITIVMENEGLSAILAEPYESSLCKEYACASNYYAECHPSLPNYLSLTSGAPGPAPTDSCGGTEYPPGGYSTPNIGTLLDSAGISWDAYQEGMNTPCAQANYPDNSGSTPANGSGGYAVRHDPFAYYANLGQASAGSICTQHVLEWSSWYAAEASSDPAQYIFITPDTCHDGHNDCSSYDGRDSADEGDYWLSTFIPQIQNQSWYSSTVIFVAYDEGVSTSTTGYNGTAGGQTYFAAISPYTKGVGNYAPDASHYDVLCTTEWLLGVGTTGNNECTPQFPAMKSLFNFSSSQPTSYPVTGTVEGINLLPVVGAGVSITGPSGTVTAVTNLSGQFSTDLPNGTYQVQVQAVGFQVLSVSENVSGPTTWSLPLLSTTPTGIYSVVGTVTSVTTGIPILGATIYANATTTSTIATSDPTGGFFLELTNGSYVLTTLAPGYHIALQDLNVTGANITGVSIGLIQIQVQPPPGFFNFTVSGLVQLYPSGAPASNAEVYANNSTVGPLVAVTATVLVNGTFAIGLGNGTYLLTVVDAGFEPTATVVSVDGAPQPNLTLSLFPHPVPVFQTTGTVVSAANNTPINGAEIVIQNGSKVIATIYTENDGAFAVPQIPNGSYVMTVTAPGYSPVSSYILISGSSVHGVSIDMARTTSITPPLTVPPTVASVFSFAGVALLAGLIGTAALGWFTARSQDRRPPKH
jgi:phosphatidylinositol-3-phosphatase